MKHVARGVSALTLALIIAACGGRREAASGGAQPAGDRKPVTIKGSDTMVILTQRLAEEYMKANAGSVVQVNGGGSGTGIAALINGTVDLAMASRPMKDDEKQKATANRGAEVVEQAIALDALAIFVNEANPVRQLSIAQVRDIFSGRTKNWQEVGGPNATIVLYGRESSSGTYDYFREHVLDKGDFASAVQTLQGTAAIINAVGHDANGIGYGGIAYSKQVRPLSIGEGASAIAPNEQSVADGTYPLSRKLFFYHLASAPERVTKFVQWSLTPEAQALVTNVGYFPLATTGAGAATDTAAATATDTSGTTATTTATTTAR